MFSITDGGLCRNCEGVSRRGFLRIGSLGLGALGLGSLGLSGLLTARARAAAAGLPVRDRSVVLLFLQGGPSHIEMFDPKMDAPAEIRSTTGEVETTLPGVTFAGTFPRLGKLARRLAVVRSYATRNSGHTYQDVVSGRNQLKAAPGSLYARVVGVNDPESGMPSNALVLPEAIRPGLKLRNNFEAQALPGLTSPGQLGTVYGAFNPAGGSVLQQNLELRVPRGRFEDRRSLLRQLDRIRRDVDSSGLLQATDRYQQQAFDVINRGIAQAFDLSREDPRTLERYDTSKLFRMEDLNRYNDMFRSSNLLGRQMLLARRLCEAGCGFVTVADAGWDMHGNSNSLPRLTGMTPLGRQVDHAVSAFLEDVHERGLDERILLVITGEMGRTPRINKRGGRDHYGNLTTLVFAGGGLNMGQVIGRSDRHAVRPATEPYGPEHLLATIMHTLFDVGKLRVTREVPGDVVEIIAGDEPIRELF